MRLYIKFTDDKVLNIWMTLWCLSTMVWFICEILLMMGNK